MTEQQFLVDFLDVLQRDEPITLDMSLKDMEEWDSMAIMACMAYLDRTFGVKTKFSQYESLDTVEAVFNLALGKD